MTALVLLPGMDGTGLLFADFIAALGPDADVTTVSYPRDKADYAELETYARARLPTDRPFVVLGESFSGPIAVSIAASKPAHCVGLILCCSFARAPRPRIPGLHLTAASIPPALLPMFLFNWLLLGRYSSPRLRSMLQKILRQVPPPVLKARLRAVSKIDVADQLARITLPALYLRATQDRLVPRAASEMMREQLPALAIEEFDAPHGLLQTAAVAAAAAVRKFLVSSTLPGTSPAA